MARRSSEASLKSSMLEPRISFCRFKRDVNMIEEQDSWAIRKEEEVEAHLQQGGVYGEAVVLGSLTTFSSGLLARAPLVLGSSSISPWKHLSNHED